MPHTIWAHSLLDYDAAALRHQYNCIQIVRFPNKNYAQLNCLYIMVEFANTSAVCTNNHNKNVIEGKMLICTCIM